MALIKFKDLPDETIPATAENINHNFEELETNINTLLKKPRLGYIYLKNNQQLSANSEAIVRFDTVGEMDEGLEFSDGGVKITADDVTKAIIICTFTFSAQIPGTYYILGNNRSGIIRRVINSGDDSQFQISGITSVKKGDVINASLYIFQNVTLGTSDTAPYSTTMQVLVF